MDTVNLIKNPDKPSTNLFNTLKNIHKQGRENAIYDKHVQPFGDDEEPFTNFQRYHLVKLVFILIVLVLTFFIIQFLK